MGQSDELLLGNISKAGQEEPLVNSRFSRRFMPDELILKSPLDDYNLLRSHYVLRGY
jgi:hypothetical protein